MNDTKLAAHNPADDPERHEYGPMMEALPTKRMREFCSILSTGTVSQAQAARDAGYGHGGTSSAATLTRIASRLLRDVRIQNAVAECTKGELRAANPRAAKTLKDLLTNTMYPNVAAKVAMYLIDKIDGPPVQRFEGNINVTHRVDHDGEAVAQLRSLMALGVAHDRLVSVFGAFGLERYQKMLALEDQKTKPIDADFEIIPDTAEAVDEWSALDD